MTTVLKHAIGSFEVFLISKNTFYMVVCIDEVSPTQSKLWGREVLQASLTRCGSEVLQASLTRCAGAGNVLHDAASIFFF